MKEEYYQEVGTYYDKDAVDYDSRYWSNPVLQRIRQSFREETKRYSGATMLEIGCGTGLDLVHFSKTHPDRKIYGIDISNEMITICRNKIAANRCTNIEIHQGGTQNIKDLFPNKKFDIIYVFFGALNTTKDLHLAAQHLNDVLNPGGHLILSFVNKWYISGMMIDFLRFRFSKAFARLKPIWGGYSPVKFLPSHCYTPKNITNAFTELTVLKKKGYSIVHPAWYFTGIVKRLGRLRRLLWSFDELLNRTFLWQFGEYTLFVFKK